VSDTWSLANPVSKVEFKLLCFSDAASPSNQMPLQGLSGECAAILIWCALVCRNEKGAALNNFARALHPGEGRCMLSVNC
jgi:hypothetical protein